MDKELEKLLNEAYLLGYKKALEDIALIEKGKEDTNVKDKDNL